MRKTFLVYLVSTVFLCLMFLMGWVGVVVKFLKLGFSWEVVTVINGVRASTFHYIFDDVLGLLFLFWIIVLLGYATYKFKYASSLLDERGINGE